MSATDTDTLSSLTREILEAAPYDTLVVSGERPPVASRLDGMTPDRLLAVAVKNVVAAYAMLAGLWLRVDDLGRCHEIAQKSPEELRRNALNLHGKEWKTSQNLEAVQNVQIDKLPMSQQLQDMTATLAFWHAIMHRREGDFSNSKYWFAKCRQHPVIAQLSYDPDDFVDAVARASRQASGPAVDAIVEMQRREWGTLFTYCVQAATVAKS